MQYCTVKCLAQNCTGLQSTGAAMIPPLRVLQAGCLEYPMPSVPSPGHNTVQWCGSKLHRPAVHGCNAVLHSAVQCSAVVLRTALACRPRLQCSTAQCSAVQWFSELHRPAVHGRGLRRAVGALEGPRLRPREPQHRRAAHHVAAGQEQRRVVPRARLARHRARKHRPERDHDKGFRA